MLEAPKSLQKMQVLFAEAATAGLEFSKTAGHFQPEKYGKEVLDLVLPIDDLSERDRVLTYNQQYWFRLFTVMQGEFPLTRHLLGVSAFNQLVMAYLKACEPESYSLNYISNELVEFLKVNDEWGGDIIKESCLLEHFYIRAFDALEGHEFVTSELDEKNIEALSEGGLNFQPSFFLYQEHWNFVELCRLVKNDDDDEIKIEPLKQIKQWAIFRFNNIVWEEELSLVQFDLLGLLRAGVSLPEACEKISVNMSEIELAQLESDLGNWFARWSSLAWFVQS